MWKLQHCGNSNIVETSALWKKSVHYLQSLPFYWHEHGINLEYLGNANLESVEKDIQENGHQSSAR